VAVTPPRQGGGFSARWAARAILVIGALFIVVGLSLLLLFGLSSPGLPATIWGLLLIVVYGFFEPDTVRGLLGQGQVRAGTRALVQVLLVLAAVLLLNVFVRDKLADKQLDLTRNRVNSLAAQTETIVRGLPKPVTATIWSNSSVSENQASFDLLQRYHALNPNLTVRSYALVDRPTLFQQQKIQQPGSVIFEVSGRPAEITTDLSEQGFDTALLRLSTGKSPKAYFLTGHGELDTTTPSGNGASATLLSQALQKQGITVAQLNLSSGAAAAPSPGASAAPSTVPSVSPSAAPGANPIPGAPAASPSPQAVATLTIPADADELVILDPRANLSAEEVSAINAYLDHGGHVLFSQAPGTKTNLNDLVKRFGLSFGSGAVVDKELQGNRTAAGVLQVTKYGQSPVSRGLDGLPSLMFESAVSGTAATGFTMVPVATSNADACEKSDLSDPAVSCGSGDKPGARNLLVTVEQSGLKAGAKPVRAVLMGGATLLGGDIFAANQQANPPGNQPLMINAINWLAGQDKIINVPPRSSTSSNIFLTDAQKSLVTLGYPLLLPLLMLGLGVNAYLRRR
jgi:hypothetical protein